MRRVERHAALAFNASAASSTGLTNLVFELPQVLGKIYSVKPTTDSIKGAFHMNGLIRISTSLILSASAALGFSIQYTLTVASSGAGQYNEATDINNLGQVVGYRLLDSSTLSRGRAFVSTAGVITDIGLLDGGLFSMAYSINDAGVVVGEATDPHNVPHAFIFRNGVLTDIDPIVGAGFTSSANGINNAGQIVGRNNIQSFIYSDGIVTDLSQLDSANDINESGQVAGTRLGHAAIYAGTTILDLGTLGGPRSSATTINEAGQVVGSSDLSDYSDQDYSHHAFLYSDGTMTDIGTLGAGILSYARDINESGQVVGRSSYLANEPSLTHGFLYSGGVLYDLNGLVDSTGSGWTILRAAAINDYGQIAATAWNPDLGRRDIVVLTPKVVPEPVTAVVLGVGLVGLLRKRRRAN